jgi:hypothetical protein
MGRGRGRGRGKASITASPVASAIEPSSGAACYQTFYDGVNDYFISTEAALKFSGAMTAAIEINLSSQSSQDTYFWNRPDATGGFMLKGFLNNNLYGIVSGSAVNSQAIAPTNSLTNGSWLKILMTCGDADTTKIYINGSLVGTAPTSATMGASASTFFMGTAGDAPSRAFHGYMRNATIMSGKTSTPSSWVPTDPSSLVGCTEVMYSLKGNDENRNSLTFSKVGDPITSECA